MQPRTGSTVSIPKHDLQRIFDRLRASGFRLIGPTPRDAAIVLDEIISIDDLPWGCSDEQQPGRYRLKRGGTDDVFAFNNGGAGWRRWLQPPQLTLFRAGPAHPVDGPAAAPDRLALIGVRPCDLAAMLVLDRVLMGGEYTDPFYAETRRSGFVLAVNCSTASGSCFCDSMGTGPRACGAFDLALTELPDLFVVEVGSDAGTDALDTASWTAATAFDLGRAQQVSARTEHSIRRELRTDHLGSVLFEALESPRWTDVADRCLGCGNCTMVCPTCFCTVTGERVALDGSTERVRRWDTCHNTAFSYVHGGSTRPSLRARCRQFFTHKFASLREQFGVGGCTGCGRCITWCPASVDVTEELAAIRAGGPR